MLIGEVDETLFNQTWGRVNVHGRLPVASVTPVVDHDLIVVLVECVGTGKGRLVACAGSVTFGNMFNDKVRARLDQETVIWMTTVRSDGQPQTSVVWFLLEGDEILVYSKAGTIRNRNVVDNPKVALNLDGNTRGGSVVTMEGMSRIDTDTPAAKDNPVYLKKYQSLIEGYRWTPEIFSRDYPVPIRVTINRVRAW